METERLKQFLQPKPDARVTGIREQDRVVEMELKEYKRLACRPEVFAGLCKECPRYGKAWACPPFDYDPENVMAHYTRIILTSTEIRPIEQGLPESRARDVIRHARGRIERALLQIEKETGGLAFGFAGGCLSCEEGSCTRLCGKPCRFPQLARPSLESYGFDITKTLEVVFAQKILWCADGNLPEYLTLVSGVMI